MKNKKNIRVHSCRFSRFPVSSFQFPVPTLLILLFLSLFVIISCSKEGENADEKETMEKQAEELVEQAKFLISTGKKIEGLTLYDKLAAEFPETETKKRVEKEMEKEGISIGVALVSWTSQRMVFLENRIIRHREAKGGYPKEGDIVSPLDAWGNMIYFKTFKGKAKAYDFIVYSNGPDRQEGTEDDILMVHQLHDAEGKKETGQSNFAHKMKTLETDSPETDSSEIVLSLDDINKTYQDMEGESQSNTMELSLEELIELNK